MGRRGPKPKSPELESAQGFPGRRKTQTKRASEAKVAPRKAAGDIQDEPSDSRFVPSPPAHLPKRAQKIWLERFADPATRLLFKSTDHGVIERYCFLRSEIERFTKKPPKPTYTTTNTFGDAVIKANPEYSQMLATMREVRAIEQVIGASPASRLGIEGKLGRGQDDPKKTGSAEPATPPPGASSRPSPLGVLKPANKLN